ncbi:MAG: hypothetical protein ACEPOW_00045 [Bacteroidales bacterium]
MEIKKLVLKKEEVVSLISLNSKKDPREVKDTNSWKNCSWNNSACSFCPVC